jgi:hypothetical protein
MEILSQEPVTALNSVSLLVSPLLLDLRVKNAEL